MYISRSYGHGMGWMNKTELFGAALRAAIRTSVCHDRPVIIVEEDARQNAGMYVEAEGDHESPYERRKILVRVNGWKVEWVS